MSDLPVRDRVQAILTPKLIESDTAQLPIRPAQSGEATDSGRSRDESRGVRVSRLGQPQHNKETRS